MPVIMTHSTDEPAPVWLSRLQQVYISYIEYKHKDADILCVDLMFWL